MTQLLSAILETAIARAESAGPGREWYATHDGPDGRPCGYAYAASQADYETPTRPASYPAPMSLLTVEQLASLDDDGYIRRVWSIDRIDAEIERITETFPPDVRAGVERKGRLGYRYTPAIYRALVIARGVLTHRAEWIRIQEMPHGPERREAEEDHFQGGWSYQRHEFESAGDLTFSRSDLYRSGIMDPIRGELLVADVKRREVQNDRRTLLEAILNDQPLPDFS